MLNLHHLELFYYVAKAGGITPSLRLIPYGIQQPAVSAQLVRLEESLGLKLFQRRPFALTPAGRDVYEHIAPFFSTIGEIATKVRKEADQHLRLSASASVLRGHLPELLRIVADENPGLRLTLREADQSSAEKLLREHEVDLSLALLEAKPAAAIESEELLRVPMVLLIPESAPFRSASDVLRAQQRNPLPLVCVPGGERLARLFQEELARRKLDWPARLETSGLDMVTCYVANGFGVGLSIAQAHRNLPGGIRALPLKGFPTLVYGALWSGKLSPTAARLLELARERAKQIAAQSEL